LFFFSFWKLGFYLQILKIYEAAHMILNNKKSKKKRKNSEKIKHKKKSGPRLIFVALRKSKNAFLVAQKSQRKNCKNINNKKSVHSAIDACDAWHACMHASACM
jgi:hypothetical protein